MIVNLKIVNSQVVIVKMNKIVGLNIKYNQIHVENIYIYYSIKY